MKTWHYVVIAVGVFLLFIWNKKAKLKERQDYLIGQQTQSAAAGAAFGEASAAAGEYSVDVYNAWGGVDLNKQNLTPADQSKYPGWYRTGDGGWWNKDTGDWYSPGSSPVALTPISAETIAAQAALGQTILAANQSAQDNLATATTPPEGYVIY